MHLSCPLLRTCSMLCPSHSSQFYHPNNIGWAVLIIKHFIMQFFRLSCYLVPLSPNSRKPQPTFLPQYERPGFTPIQYNRQSYSSVYPNLHIFGE
jgi:hypothetical protein